MKHNGFTLIELLIVIVIILILAGILYPVFATVRSKALQVKCSTQMRQIGMAIQVYCSDHDDTPPMGGYMTLPAPTALVPHPTQFIRVDWEDVLLSNAYLRNAEVLACPLAPTNDYRYSYGVNRWVMGWMHSIVMDSVPFPSNTVLMTEKVGYDWVAWEPTANVNNPYFLSLDPRHSHQLNVLFCDGHVRKVAIGEVIVGKEILWNPQSAF